MYNTGKDYIEIQGPGPNVDLRWRGQVPLDGLQGSEGQSDGH
jgi:hypothetical protein